MPSMWAPSVQQKAAEVLDVGLARSVADHGLALGQDCRHERVLGSRHAGLVEEDVGTAEPVGLQLERLPS